MGRCAQPPLAAALLLLARLQQAFDALRAEFAGRVEFGWLKRAQASPTHYLVWGANAGNVRGSPGAFLSAGRPAAWLFLPFYENDEHVAAQAQIL